VAASSPCLVVVGLDSNKNPQALLFGVDFLQFLVVELLQFLDVV
jgi:hypothetical protein